MNMLLYSIIGYILNSSNRGVKKMNRISGMVSAKLEQWEMENAGYFCRIMRKGGEWSFVQYPTGLILVRATNGTEMVEIHKATAKMINKNNWTIATKGARR
jgi:hypothetical protein